MEIGSIKFFERWYICITQSQITMDIKYPIGKPIYVENPSEEEIQGWIADIAALPEQIQETIEGFSDEVLEKSYREGGWNAKQLIHHLVHSHMNSLFRVQYALTEDNPTVMSYNREAWVNLDEKFGTPVELSLFLLEEIHTKMVLMYNSITGDEWQRTFENPDAGQFTILKSLMLYAWHCRHHLAHIKLITKN